MSEFEKSLNKFLEKETYIVAYRSNYDSAREFNNELINYIKQLKNDNAVMKANLIQVSNEKLTQLENNWNELKKWIRDYLKLFDNPDYFEEQSIEDLNEVLNKMQELENRKV